ncbi:heme ABC transporter substrate-binding protein IsdE [Sporosarcina ureilytica]|uniref:High-affinity heme uptake system protein IsdE n=1 Tax=Sporosarcina ureilytica TaxID=298596 RepID=A0A1D8JE06_9BACL|nr:heme ABC transporter substrate-binding protein IsdE [Sporosarcina ureilytica]AOV06947.1 heme ABC transporter substrate-binding protein IsdE [Sporosarcina ureilytica]
MKTKLNFFLIIVLLVVLAGCGTNDQSTATENQSSKDTHQNNSEVADATKNEQALETDGQIISTTVAITEITDQLELDLVGIPTTYKGLPKRYKGLPEVGLAMDPDMEIIKSLKPTDVLTVTTLTSYVEETFTQTDTPATYLDFESVEGMYEGIQYLGEKYNREEHAEKLVEAFEEKLAEIEAKIKDQESPKVLILLGVPGSYLVATEESYVGDLVRRAGGVNAMKETGVEYISANTENLQQAEADIILRMAHGMPEEVVEMFNKEFKENTIWRHFKAVKNERVYDLEEVLFGTTANLAAVEALEELVKILYE